MKKEELKIGDKVVKISGKPFKCGFKTATIKDFTINPHSKKEAAIILEDDSIVNLEIITNKPMSNKSNAQKQLRKIEVILDNYNIPYDEDIPSRLCHLLCKADEACRQVVIDVFNNTHEDVSKYVNDFDKYLHAEEENEED